MTNNNTTAPAAVDFNDTDSLKAELQRLQNENKALAEKSVSEKKLGTISFKSKAPFVDEKDGKEHGGNVGIYGLGRYPVTMYLSQIVSMFRPTTILALLEFTLSVSGHLKSKGATTAEADAAKAKQIAELKALIATYKKLV